MNRVSYILAQMQMRPGVIFDRHEMSLLILLTFGLLVSGTSAEILDDIISTSELSDAVFTEELQIMESPEASLVTLDEKNLEETYNNKSSSNKTRKLISCQPLMINATSEERAAQVVELINATRLAEILTPEVEITSKESAAQCTIILFYSKQCPFSYMAAPHFNALARAFPDIKTAALDSVKESRVNTQYGIVGVPSIILFHNARAVAKFNNSEYSLQGFIKFIKLYTGIQEESDTLRIKDFEGPVPREINDEIDYILLLAWGFILVCVFYYISGTQTWKKIIETMKKSWREAEAQHEHAE